MNIIKINKTKATIAIYTFFGKAAPIIGYIGAFSILLPLILKISSKSAELSVFEIVIRTISICVCIFFIIIGTTIKKRIERFREYVKVISVNHITSFNKIARHTAHSIEYVRKDLAKMIDDGFFVDAVLDDANGEIKIGGPDHRPEFEPYQCKSCGANSAIEKGKVSHCEYCGSPVGNQTINIAVDTPVSSYNPPPLSNIGTRHMRLIKAVGFCFIVYLAVMFLGSIVPFIALRALGSTSSIESYSSSYSTDKKEAEKLVDIDEVADSNEPVDCYLSELEWVNASDDWGGFIYYDNVTDNFGDTYEGGFGGRGGNENSFQDYKLNGNYKELRGRIVLNYDVRTQTDEGICLWIHGDNGELLYQSSDVYAGVEPIDFSVDLSGIDSLSIEIVGKNMLRLVDCMIIAAPPAERYIKTANSLKANEKLIPLNELTWFNASESGNQGLFDFSMPITGFIHYKSVIDNFGTSYRDGISGNDGYAISFQEYRLNSGYEKIEGRIILSYENKDKEHDEVKAWIYGDGELLYESPAVTAGTRPIDFSVDLSNVKDMRIEIYGKSLLRIVNCWVYSK